MRQFLLLLFFVPALLFGRKVSVPRIHPEIENPWLTGPLLAPSALVVTRGHFDYEPYTYITAITGTYDSDGKVKPAKKTFWANSFQPEVVIGLSSWADIEILPTLFYNYHDHQAHWNVGDFQVELDIALYTPRNPESWIPAVKFSVIETFPTGTYKKLNRTKKGTQATGEGSFQTSPGIVFGKLFHLGGVHFMTTRLFFQYALPAPTRLKGLNFYGGASDTNAKFFPPQNFSTDFGVEITLAQNWALACDILGVWGTRTHFSGNPGTDESGNPASLGIPSSTQYSLAPAIEYNWSDNLGMIAGSWFSFAGRNSGRFWSIVFAVNYYQ